MFARILAAAAAACVYASVPTAAQQIAATAHEEQLLAQCRSIFDGKTFAGIIKNADYFRYKSGRRELVIRTSVKDGLKLVSTQSVCRVVVHAETDDHYSDVREYLFDGSVANTNYELTYGRHQRSLAPEGSCVRYTGTSTDNYGTVSSVGNSLLCPR